MGLPMAIAIPGYNAAEVPADGAEWGSASNVAGIPQNAVQDSAVLRDVANASPVNVTGPVDRSQANVPVHLHAYLGRDRPSVGIRRPVAQVMPACPTIAAQLD